MGDAVLNDAHLLTSTRLVDEKISRLFLLDKSSITLRISSLPPTGDYYKLAKLSHLALVIVLLCFYACAKLRAQRVEGGGARSHAHVQSGGRKVGRKSRVTHAPTLRPFPSRGAAAMDVFSWSWEAVKDRYETAMDNGGH